MEVKVDKITQESLTESLQVPSAIDMDTGVALFLEGLAAAIVIAILAADADELDISVSLSIYLQGFSSFKGRPGAAT
jgi:hypothetical protein